MPCRALPDFVSILVQEELINVYKNTKFNISIIYGMLENNRIATAKSKLLMPDRHTEFANS